MERSQVVASNPFVKKEAKEEKEAEKKSSGKKLSTNDANQPTEFIKADVAVEELPLTPIEQPPGGEGALEGGEEVVEEEEFSLKDSQSICQSLWNIPAVFLGDHLILEATQTNSFAKHFHIYCIKKGIDPFDYFFDEFGIAMAALPLAQSLLKAHREFKATQEGAKGKTKQDKKGKEEEERREKERETVKGGEENETPT